MSLREIIVDAGQFIQNVNEPYVKVEGVSENMANHIRQQYIPQIIGHSDDVKTKILSILEESWDRNRAHGNVRRWGRAARGIAEYLLMPTEIGEIQIDVAADVVVRISRWFHTTENNLWKRFTPYASQVVHLAWGHIEELYNISG